MVKSWKGWLGCFLVENRRVFLQKMVWVEVLEGFLYCVCIAVSVAQCDGWGAEEGSGSE
jgi:hypothetical protein